MAFSNRTARWSLLVLWIVPACADAPPATGWTDTGVLAIEGATIFTSPRTTPVEDGVVLIVDGLIEAVGVRGSVPIPQAAVRIDGSGLSLLPGFWNAQVLVDSELLESANSGSADQLQLLLQERFNRFGFTTVVETNTPSAGLARLIERIQSGEVLGPRIVAVGGAGVTGVRWVGAAEWLGPPAALLEWAESETALVPSLRLAQQEIVDGAVSPVAEVPIDLLLDRVRSFVEAGGRLVFGSGAGFVPQYDPLSDLLLLAEAGVPFSVQLASLTTEPALRFGFSYLGEIEPGMVADLVLLDSDPEVDATAFGQVRMVLREGRPIFLR